jgi:hypothetical protein
MTRNRKASTSVLALALALLLLVGADHLLASSRAAGLCALFRPGLDGAQVNALISKLPGTQGFLSVRGNPARTLTPQETADRRQEFMQFAIVFKGLFFSTRQCVVSVKTGRVENSHVTHSDAYVMLHSVQTVRSR